MKNWITLVLLITVGGFAVSLLGPWWSIAAVGLIAGLLIRLTKPGAGFWAGLLGGALVWGLAAAYFDGVGGELPTMIAQLFGVGSGFVLGLVVAFVGGLTVGLPTLLGCYLRATFQPLQT